VTDLHMQGDKKGIGLAQMLTELGFAVEQTATCNLGYIAGARARKLGAS